MKKKQAAEGAPAEDEKKKQSAEGEGEGEKKEETPKVTPEDVEDDTAEDEAEGDENPEDDSEEEEEESEEEETPKPKKKSPSTPKKSKEAPVKVVNGMTKAQENLLRRNLKIANKVTLDAFNALPDEIKELAPGDPKKQSGLDRISDWLPKAQKLAEKLKPAEPQPRRFGNTSPKPVAKPGESFDTLLAEAKKNPYFTKL